MVRKLIKFFWGKLCGLDPQAIIHNMSKKIENK